MSQGFTRTATGFRAWVRVTSKSDDFDRPVTKRFGREATPRDIKAWRTTTRDRLRRELDAHRKRRAEALGLPGTFRADAAEYLKAVKALTTFKEREREIGLWVDEFGDRTRASIKAHEIRVVRDRWLTIGPRREWQTVNGVGQWVDVWNPLSASTVNHRLRALSNLYTVLDGRHAPNPLRDVPEVDEPVDVPRALDYDTIRRILDAMSDQGQALKGKGNRRTYSLAKVRARVMAWTGITPKELGKIEAADIHWDDAFLLVPARRKGRGAPGRIVPLGPEALKALQDFHAQNAYGRFTARVVLRAWQRACRDVLGRPVRLYDLRHSFVTAIVKATGTLDAAQLQAGHKDRRTTRRYGMAAMLPMLRAATNATFPTDKEKPS